MKPSKTLMAKVLAESITDPRIAGPFKIIADMADPKFLRQRAIELLYEADSTDSDQRMKQAISFLALARCLVRENPEPKSRLKLPVNPNTKPSDYTLGSKYIAKVNAEPCPLNPEPTVKEMPKTKKEID